MSTRSSLSLFQLRIAVTLVVALLLIPLSLRAEDCDDEKSKAEQTCGTPSPDDNAIDTGSSSAGLNGNANKCEAQKKVNDSIKQKAMAEAQKCRDAYNKCKSTCEQNKKRHDAKKKAEQSKPEPNPGIIQQEQSAMDKADKNKNECDSYEGKYAAKDDAQAANGGANSGQNSDCKNDNSQQGGQPPQMPQQQGDQNKPDPSQTPMPDAAKTPTPNVDKIANGAAAKGASTSSGGPTVSKSLNTNGDFGPQWGTGITSNGGSGGGNGTTAGSGGGGGGGIGLGGGGGGGGSSPAKTDKDGKKEAAGASHGSGGGGMVGGGGGGSSGGGGAPPPDPQYLKMKAAAKNAATAGMSVKPVDGITGPMGKSIFEKISSQYQLQRHTMIND